MKKIKILYYSHTIDFGGTWRSHERILLNLDNDVFDPYVFYNPNQDNNRLDFLKNVFPIERIIPFSASLNKTGPNEGYSYVQSNFYELCEKYNFDIIHFARGGYFEWPFVKRICPIQIETNIFGGMDNSEFLDCSVSISDTVKSIRGDSDYIIYNPIPSQILNDDNLKSELKINNDEIVFGRIGRKDNFHSISFESLKVLKNLGLKFKFIIIGACDNAKACIQNLDLNDRCILIDVTNDDDYIHRFHNTIDIFLHYRSDGETFGTAIAQSMMYGKPVISHFAGYNAQSEIINDGGFVCNSVEEYSNKILELCNNANLYNEISSNAKRRALDFEERKIVNQWETLYKKLYQNTK